MKNRGFILFILLLWLLSFAQEKGGGGPDSYGYIWIDSDQAGGPTYSWVEISGIGTALNLGLNKTVNKSIGFDFNFYGTNYNTVNICSNGFLSFTSTSTAASNNSIPQVAEPNAMIAVFWDYFNTYLAGTRNIYTYYDSANSRFIVEFYNYIRYGQSTTNTFQVILKSNGDMILQYKELNGTLNSATVGIENQAGTVGLQVAYNQAYLKNNLAIKLGLPSADGTLVTSPTSLSYGNVEVGNDSTRTFTVTNTHLTETMEGQITTISGYTVSEVVKNAQKTDKNGKNVLSYEIGINSSKTYNLVFAPYHSGSHSGYIEISSSDTSNPKDSIAVTGSGVAADIRLSSTDTLKSTVYTGLSDSKNFTIYNDGTGGLNYSISAAYKNAVQYKGSGGPDNYNYFWKDSDDPNGPVYTWTDISGIGTSVAMGDEVLSDPKSLGFDFNFYGNVYSSVRISSNGFLTFGIDQSYTATALPNPATPNDIICAYWTDLTTMSGSYVYYYYDSANERFIVQYENMPNISTTNNNTFQIVLYKNGDIEYYYKQITKSGFVYTVGMENSTGTDASLISYNTNYLTKDLFAVRFRPIPKWLSFTPSNGSVSVSGSQGISVSLNSTDLPTGISNADIKIASNDPVYPTVTIPVWFKVLPIPVPVLSSPANSSYLTDLTPTFDWSDVTIATSYTLLVDNDLNFSSPVINQSPTASTYTPSVNMAVGTYYWKVRTNTAGLPSEYSAYRTVNLGNLPAAPSLSSPANASLTTDLTPTFDWGDISGATSYTIQIDDLATFASPNYSNSPTVSTYTPVSNLPVGTWYWRVLATNAFGSSGYSGSWSVQLGNLPAVPSLSTPTNASSTTDLTPTFDWGDVSGATSYTILVDNNSNFISPEINQSPATSTYTRGTDLVQGTYYWKVLATNAFGSSAYCGSWSVILQRIPAIPTGFVNSIVSGNVRIDWNNSEFATSYDVYFSATPYATWPSGWGTPTNVVVSEITYTPTASKMFFRVVAKN